MGGVVELDELPGVVGLVKRVDDLLATEELLEALRAKPSAPSFPRKKKAAQHNDALLEYFLYAYLALKKPVRRGSAGMPSIRVCSLYRMYAEWHQASSGNEPPMNPRQFCNALARAKVKKRRMYHGDEQGWFLVFTAEGSRRLIRWLEENPDPFGYPAEFAKQIGVPNVQRNEAAPAGQAAGEATRDVQPDPDPGP